MHQKHVDISTRWPNSEPAPSRSSSALPLPLFRALRETYSTVCSRLQHWLARFALCIGWSRLAKECKRNRIFRRWPVLSDCQESKRVSFSRQAPASKATASSSKWELRIWHPILHRPIFGPIVHIFLYGYDGFSNPPNNDLFLLPPCNPQESINRKPGPGAFSSASTVFSLHGHSNESIHAVTSYVATKRVKETVLKIHDLRWGFFVAKYQV